MTQHTYGYKDTQFTKGDFFLFKEEDINRWTGPAKVIGVKKSKVKIINDVYNKTVPSCRVLPFEDVPKVLDSNHKNLDNNGLNFNKGLIYNSS